MANPYNINLSNLQLAYDKLGLGQVPGQVSSVPNVNLGIVPTQLAAPQYEATNAPNLGGSKLADIDPTLAQPIKSGKSDSGFDFTKLAGALGGAAGGNAQEVTPVAPTSPFDVANRPGDPREEQAQKSTGRIGQIASIVGSFFGGGGGLAGMAGGAKK